MLDYNESKNVLGQVFEEIRNRIHMKIIETDLIHQYIKLILLNDVIMASYEQIIELFMVLHNTKTNEEKQKIFSSFLMNNKLDVNSVNINVDEYKNEVKNDSELLKVLIISKRNPSCLVGYSLCKTIRKSNDRIKKYISNVVINKYLNYFSEQNNINKIDIENELKLLKKDYLEKILFSLFEKSKLPLDLMNNIYESVKDIKMLSDDILKTYDIFESEPYINNNVEILYDLKMTEFSNIDFLFTDADSFFSIFSREELLLDSKKFNLDYHKFNLKNTVIQIMDIFKL